MTEPCGIKGTRYLSPKHPATSGRAFRSYALAKSIFIDPDLSGKVQELLGLISKAFEADYWAKFDPHDPEIRKEVRAAYQTLMEDGAKLPGEIESVVSARLRTAASGS